MEAPSVIHYNIGLPLPGFLCGTLATRVQPVLRGQDTCGSELAWSTAEEERSVRAGLQRELGITWENCEVSRHPTQSSPSRVTLTSLQMQQKSKQAPSLPRHQMPAEREHTVLQL